MNDFITTNPTYELDGVLLRPAQCGHFAADILQSDKYCNTLLLAIDLLLTNCPSIEDAKQLRHGKGDYIYNRVVRMSEAIADYQKGDKSLADKAKLYCRLLQPDMRPESGQVKHIEYLCTESLKSKLFAISII